VRPVPPQVFCDTSFFYACLDARDAHYEDARLLLAFCAEHRVAFLTTWEVLVETVTLLRIRRGYRLAVAFLDTIVPTLRIVEHAHHIREAALSAFRRLSRDQALSVCDALSYVLVTELLDDIPCLAFDADFRSLGLTVLSRPPL